MTSMLVIVAMLLGVELVRRVFRHNADYSEAVKGGIGERRSAPMAFRSPPRLVPTRPICPRRRAYRTPGQIQIRTRTCPVAPTQVGDTHTDPKRFPTRLTRSC